MKSAFLFILFLFPAMYTISAQQTLPIEYSHDAAGNRVVRSVMVMRSEGEKTTDTVTYIEKMGLYDIRLSPNPTRGIVCVSNPQKEMKMRLFDSQGRLLQTAIIKEENAEIDLSSRPDGVYIAEFECADTKKTIKIIKKR